MIISKRKSRAADIECLKLKQFIEMTIALNCIKTGNLISIESSRLKSKKIVNILSKLELISKISNKENKYRPRYHISDQLEELLYNEISNHKDFKQYIKNNT